MFWGLTIEPGKHYTQTVEESFHVSMAALETRDVASPERDKVKMTQLMVQHDKAEFLVCTLCCGSNIFQQYLDLNFTEGEEVTFFTEGRATIHLTGYLVRDEPMSMDPDMMSLDEASSSDGAASNSEGLASGEESPGEAQVKVERSYKLQRGRRRRRVLYSDIRQKQRKQLIWADRQLCWRKRKAPPLINFKEKTFINRKRGVRCDVDDETLRGGQNFRSIPSKRSLSCPKRGFRVSNEQNLLTEEIPSETPSAALLSTVLAQVHADAPMPWSVQEDINQHETGKVSSAVGHLELCDLTGMDTNSPSADEQGHFLTTPTTTFTIAKTNLSTPSPKNQFTHTNDAEDKGCTSYVGFPGKRKEIRPTKKGLEKHISPSRGIIPAIQSKHRGVFRAGRLNYHQLIMARLKNHATKQQSGQSSFAYTTSSSHRKRTSRGAKFLTSSRGQPTRHARINSQDTSESTFVRGGSSQPVISNVVGGPEAAVMTRMHLKNFGNDGGQRLKNRELHTDGANSQVEMHNLPIVEIHPEQRGQSSTAIFQPPLTLRGLKEEQSGSTTEQVPSMGYDSSLVPTSLIVAYPGESNPLPRPEDGTPGFVMPETDSVYWSCMSDETGVVTGASTTDGIPVASDMKSLTAFDLSGSGINMPDQKIRLAHGYDVFIMQRDLLQAERTSKQSWSIFVRRLLDVLFDRVTLAMGRASNFGASHSDRTPLDQNVVGALRAFFKARFNINKRELMQAIGYYCHDLRYKMMQDLQSM